VSVHKIPAIPGKFKEEKDLGRKRKTSVSSRIQQMKNRRTAADEIGQKGRGEPMKKES
jgi:hypothetical protein